MSFLFLCTPSVCLRVIVCVCMCLTVGVLCTSANTYKYNFLPVSMFAIRGIRPFMHTNLKHVCCSVQMFKYTLRCVYSVCTAKPDTDTRITMYHVWTVGRNRNEIQNVKVHWEWRSPTLRIHHSIRCCDWENMCAPNAKLHSKCRVNFMRCAIAAHSSYTQSVYLLYIWLRSDRSYYNTNVYLVGRPFSFIILLYWGLMASSSSSSSFTTEKTTSTHSLTHIRAQQVIASERKAKWQSKRYINMNTHMNGTLNGIGTMLF